MCSVVSLSVRAGDGGESQNKVVGVKVQAAKVLTCLSYSSYCCEEIP